MGCQQYRFGLEHKRHVDDGYLQSNELDCGMDHSEHNRDRCEIHPASARVCCRYPISPRPAHICGLGQYEMSIDGVKAGQNFLSPAWSRYNKTVLYDTYDIIP